MVKRIILVIFFLCIINPQDSFSAWYFSAENLQNVTELPNTEYKFNLEDLNCIISKSSFHKISATETVEFRTLGCNLPNDFYVEISVTCDLPSQQANSLYIRAKDKEYNPFLMCAPKKMNTSDQGQMMNGTGNK